MSNRTQFEPNCLRDPALIISYYSWQFIRIIFELESGVMTTPKRRSILPALIFTCFYSQKGRKIPLSFYFSLVLQLPRLHLFA